MEKFFTVYEKIRKWLVVLLFVGTACFLYFPVNISGTSYSFLQNNFNDKFVNDSLDKLIIAPYNSKVVMIVSLILFGLFLLFAIMTLVYAFFDTNFPSSIALGILLVLLLLTFGWRTNVTEASLTPDDRLANAFIQILIAYDKFNLIFGMYYIIPISVVIIFCIILELLHRRYA